MADLQSSISAVVDAVEHSLHDLPASTPAAAVDHSSHVPRALGRKKSIHQVLGGGKSADVLLWREKPTSAGLLAGATAAWFLFQVAGYTVISVLSNALLFTTVILFVWANIASLLNRPPPPIPKLELSEELVSRLASVLREELNKTLAVAYDVAIGKDFRVFFKVVAVLWFFSKIGGWFSFLTLLYIGLLGAHTLPVLYERYQTEIDKYIDIAVEVAKKQYLKIDELVISKILGAPTKEKKVQ
ncbi:hypothetical protein O6H91_06G038700 [Diphasiastrum complanatum]|uniref:Uncharacterized protein n=1 Tax=Diphasiastrum complanatum TaxID=34168 RepID=A0ACC2DD10_DIPCM|nr:hypothetical protein O6H91_06G038700 [Diphasiastrum complanatum]